MGKIPYLFRRRNVYYFRIRVPTELRGILKARTIVRSLKTENRHEAIAIALQLAANVSSALYDFKTEKISTLNLDALLTQDPQSQAVSKAIALSPAKTNIPLAPLLSTVVNDFLQRYNQRNTTTLSKLKSTLPIFVELVGDKPINTILQAEVNNYFELVQKLPIRRDSKKYRGKSIKKIIATHSGRCISEGTFDSTYRATVSLLINWASVHYKDQGFPSLTVQGAVYRGDRAYGINKQRALKPSEINTLFTHPMMQKYAKNPKYAHYCWLPLIGLFTGARINEVCQLNPFTDIKQDQESGIWYLHFTDESEAAVGVNKSIKTNSSYRIVPIHSKLLKLGFLHYVERLKNNNNKCLFPAWQPRKGKASTNASRWFIRYLEIIGLRDDSVGARLSGFHCFRHTFITHGMQNKISGIFAITGHDNDVVEGIGKISAVAKGYWTQGITDNIIEKQATIERFDFGNFYFMPS